MILYGDTIQEVMQLAYKMGDGVQIEVLGTSNRRVMVAAAVAARRCCKQDIVM